MKIRDTRILILEESLSDYSDLLGLLLEMGYCEQLLTHHTGYDEALHRFMAGDVDLVLVDYELGEERTGLDWLHESRAQQSEIPVILLTREDQPKLDHLALQAGAIDYIDKHSLSVDTLRRTFRYAFDRARLRAELVRSEGRYRSLVEVQSNLICRFAPDTTLTFVNAAYCEYFRRTPDELLGMPFLNLIPEQQHAGVLKHIAHLIESGQPVTYEHEVMTPFQGLRWQRWTDHIIFDDEGRVTELQSVGMDITELKETQHRLEIALSHERELNQLKTRFISMTSHEFRTPLALIQSSAETLDHYADKLDPEDRQTRYARIYEHVAHMTRMLDDILLIGKFEGGDLSWDLEVVRVGELLTGIIEQYRALHTGHDLVWEDGIGSFIMETNQSLLRQIVTNLLSNACKYSPRATPIVLAACVSGSTLQIRVSDEGLGIPEAELALIFDPFYRSANVDTIRGTGLGLTIVQRAVLTLRGTITVESEVGVGTTVSVRLPVDTAK